MEKKRRIGVSGYLIILLLIACVYYLISGIRNGSSISYSEMRQLFEQEKVEFPKRFFETPSLHGLLDEATAYEAQRKFNALTNALLEKFEPSPEPKAASDK